MKHRTGPLKPYQEHQKHQFRTSFPLNHIALSVAVAFTPLSSAFAQVVPDPNAGQYRPGMSSAANGVPVVNITAPSSSGVSRNQYHQFNVQQQGVILNNSTVNTQTQLGGWVQGNPNLSYGAARVILNEVTSGNPSLLQGYIEVGGQRAEVIIANPAGISVDGAGFINAAGVTLTTGTPVFNNSGNLESYRVSGGRVSIGGAGLDTSTADYTRIITRAAEINSGLWANDLTMAAGTGSFAPDGTPIQLTGLTVEDEHGKPLYAIDVAQLGGMYAGKIRLIGTEHGVGVRNAGHIGAQAGQVTVTADGMLVNSGTINSSHMTAASSGIQVAAASGISNTGSLYTQGQLVLNSNGTLSNQGTLAAQGNVSLNAQNINNSADALIAAGMDSNGTFNTEGQLNATAQQLLSNQGQMLSGGNTTIAADTFNNNATTQAGGNLDITAQTLDNQDAKLIASGEIRIQAGDLQNQRGLVAGADSTSIDAQHIDNSAGVLIAGNHLAVQTDQLNGAGQILSEGNADITVQGDYTAGADNQIIANGILNIGIQGALTNAGEIMAGDTAQITAHSIDNQLGGEISAGTNQITATDTLTNRGLIDGGRTYIDANQLTNTGTGRIYGGHVGIQANTLTNRDETISGQSTSAVIAARERMDIGAGTLNNLNGAVLFSAGDMAIGGSLDQNHIAQGRADLIYNDGATIETLGDMQIAAASIENRNTAFASQDSTSNGGHQTTIIISGDQRYDISQILVLNGDGGYLWYPGQNVASLIALLNDPESAIVLPSDTYPFETFGPQGGLNQIPVSAYVPQHTVYQGEDAITVAEAFNYDQNSPLWALFGVAAPDAPIPTHPGFTCEGYDNCSGVQRQQYQAYLAEYNDWKDRNLGVYGQLNIQIAAFLSDLNARTVSEFYVDDYDIIQHDTIVTASNPGQISAGGNMLLDGNLINDKSRITAGSTIATTGNVQTIDAKGQSYQEHNGTSSYTYIQNHTLSDPERRWQSDFLNVTQPATEVSLIVSTPQQNTTPQGSGTQIGNIPVVQLPNGDLIQAAQPNTRIPASSLYQINPGSNKNYLVETDPRFASYSTWLTSDYMLSALGLDPATTQKRLGDGFYEQQLIREQIGQLTGYRYLAGYLAGYLSDEAQYQALMNAGVEFAQEYNLTVGVALTAEQMAQLTGDIVWLVSTEVTLPDGTTETVLVPQLYTRTSTAMITAGGSLISANNVSITGQNGNPVLLSNNATIAGREGLFVDVAYLQNKVGQLHGGDVVLRSATDIDNIGGVISGDNSIAMMADRDINIVSTVSEGHDAQGRITGIGNVATVYLSGAPVVRNEEPEQYAEERASTSYNPDERAGQIIISAGRDINMRAGLVINDVLVTVAQDDASLEGGAASDTTTGVAANTTYGGVTTLTAGRNIDLSTVTTEQQHTANFDDKNWRSEETRAEVGSQIQGTGDINLIADNNLHLRASAIESQSGNINAVADTIAIEAGESYHNDTFARHHESGGLFNSKTQDNLDSYSQTNLIGSSLSAEEINLVSNKDLTLSGSSAVATHDINLVSETGNVNIVAGTASSNEYHYERVKESGVFDSGAAMTIGTQQTTTTDKLDRTYAVASTVGSLQGIVAIMARQGSYNQTGSDLVALQGDVNVIAQDINILEARETARREQSYEFEQTGLTLGVSNPLINMAQTANRMSDAADRTSNSRLDALAAATTGLSAANAYDSVKGGIGGLAGMENASDLTKGAAGAAGVDISITFGQTRAQSTTTETADTSRGSTINAGGSVRLVATGRPTGEDSPNTGGNLLIQGSSINATQNVMLVANDRIDIRAAADTASQRTQETSSSWGAGLAISVGQGGVSYGITANASRSKGHADGDDKGWTYSHINAGETLTIASGGDTNIIGGQVSGDTVKANIGGNLNIESLQETSTYDSKHEAIGGSVTAGYGFSASANYNNSDINSNYASVTEYAGIMAGSGGFDITVAGNTDLKGAIIASTQEAVDNNKNQLTTGSLTISHLYNHADYDAKQSGFGAGFGIGGQPGDGTAGSYKDGTGAVTINNPTTSNPNPSDAGHWNWYNPSGDGPSAGVPVTLKDSGESSNWTLSGISGGQITITDEEAQQRLTGQTADEIIASLNRGVLTGDTPDVLQPIFDEDEIRAGFEITGEFGNQVNQFLANRSKEAEAERKAASEALQTETDPTKRAELAQTANGTSIWDAGGTGRLVLTAITAAANGNISGSGAEMLQDAAVNALQGLGAQQVKEIADSFMAGDQKTAQSEAVRTALHTVLACGGAAAQSADCGTGAAGAAASVVLNNLVDSVTGTSGQNLSAEEKEQRINLITTIIAGITEAAGGDSAVARAAAQIEMENNYLTSAQALAFDKELASCKAAGGDCIPVVEKYLALSNENRAEVIAACDKAGYQCAARMDLIEGANGVTIPKDYWTVFKWAEPEYMKDPDAIAITQYLNALDYQYASGNTSSLGRIVWGASDGIAVLPLLASSAGVSVVAGQTSKAGTYNVALAQFEMQNALKGMAISGSISGVANAGIQYATSGEINPTDVVISTVVGGLTYGQTPATIIAANAGAGGLSAAIKGQDPIQGVIVSGLGATVGVGANKIISNQIGRFFTPAQTGSITKPVTIWDSWGMNYTPKSLFPALSGNIGESVTSEVIQINVNEIWNSIRNDQK
jgi:filamentous hemagglutinin